MKPITTVIVNPSLPAKLEHLEELAYNLRWTWTPSTVELFKTIDPELWVEVYHNPVQMIGRVSQVRMEELACDPHFLKWLEWEYAELQKYLSADTWYHRYQAESAEGGDAAAAADLSVAYFSAEFGLSEVLPLYSGGLGVLAGDHMKSASDLGVPMTGVGIFYQQGYFTQYLNQDGWQQETYLENDFYTIPVRRITDEEGHDLKLYLEYPEGRVAIRIWKVQVGRNPLYLLDTNLDENSRENRAITGQLYGGDEEMRIRQEILLGMGGLRALDLLGRRPTVCHLNEGYAGFLALERMRQAIEERGFDFDTAEHLAAAGNVFTTHTPVPAGHDVFHPELVEHYLRPFAKQLGIDLDQLLGLGRLHPGNPEEGFNMTILGLRLSRCRNGVSKLHGEVSRHMWKNHWPGLPEAEVPIGSITNGIHLNSWLSAGMRGLLERHVGPEHLEEPPGPDSWSGAEEISSEEIWGVHEERRQHLVQFVRRRMQQQLNRGGAAAAEVAKFEHVLDENALTIGFARRFATYKRATLLLRDPDRLARLLCNPDRPVQIIFAGKSHPHDNYGKELIREIIHLSKREDLVNRIVFVADYDMSVARYLVQGCDIWLNTPMRPLEASGTSGMKAMVNGALNLSILDGWWAEAFEIDGGWAIGRGEEYDDQSHQDTVEANALYEILETEVVPMFYERDEHGIPWSWVDRMRKAVSLLAPLFTAHRMVAEYVQKSYLPSHAQFTQLSQDGGEGAKRFTEWMRHVESNWSEVKIEEVNVEKRRSLKVGDELEVRSSLSLGALAPEDVCVELYHGLVDGKGEIAHGTTLPMHPSAEGENGRHLFIGRIPCDVSGRRGFTVRVLPQNDAMSDRHEPRLITWAEAAADELS